MASVCSKKQIGVEGLERLPVSGHCLGMIITVGVSRGLLCSSAGDCGLNECMGEFGTVIGCSSTVADQCGRGASNKIALTKACRLSRWLERCVGTHRQERVDRKSRALRRTSFAGDVACEHVLYVSDDTRRRSSLEHHLAACM